MTWTPDGYEYEDEIDGTLTMPCGCQIQIEAACDTGPTCRCGGGCWNEPPKWSVEGKWVSNCEEHSV
jgi:hypothetical protein